jgi:hypothetical protein
MIRVLGPTGARHPRKSLRVPGAMSRKGPDVVNLKTERHARDAFADESVRNVSMHSLVGGY